MIKQVTFPELVWNLTLFEQVRVYEQIQADPTIVGYVLYRRRELGAPPMDALLPYGPNCTFKTVEELEGKGLELPGAPLGDPRWPSAYALVPSQYDILSPKLVTELKKQSYETLPGLWVHRLNKNGIWINDQFVNPETNERYSVVTTGDHHVRFLVCPTAYYTDEKETDPASPTYGHVKNNDMWFWVSLADLLAQGFSIVEDRHGMPHCRLVATKNEDNAN